MSMKPFIIAARYKYLLLLPFAVILPVTVVMSALSRSSTYTSGAKLWVEDQVLVPTVQGGNSYLSPAQNTANDLNELLATDSFTLEVAKNAGMPVNTDAEKGAALSAIRSGTAVWAEGRSLFDVQHSASSPEPAKTIAAALSQTFIDYTRETTKQRIQEAIDFDQGVVLATQGSLNDAQKKLAEYRPASGADSQLATLTANVQAAQLAVSNASAQLRKDQELLQSPGTQDPITLRDPAALPAGPDPVKKTKLLLFPAAGLLLALSLSAALFGFALRADNSIRVAEDLQALPGLLLLGSVPDVSKVKKRPWPKHFFRLAVTALGTTLQR